MAIPVTKVEIAGGAKGWGGLVNREDRMGLLPNQASDCLNVWDANGILKKRSGYDSTGTDAVSGIKTMKRVAVYEPTRIGGHPLKGSGYANTLAQEVVLATSRGGDYEPEATPQIIRVEANIKGNLGSSDVWFELWSKDGGTGAPSAKLATSTKQKLALSPDGEQWSVFDFDAIDLNPPDPPNVLIVMQGDYPLTTDEITWTYGNSVYSGTEKAWRYNSGAWVEIAGNAFQVRVYQTMAGFNRRRIVLADKYLTVPDITTRVQLWEGYNNARLLDIDTPSNLSNYVGATLFVEGEQFAYKIQAAEDNTTEFLISPPYPNTSGNKKCYISPKKVMQNLNNEGLEVNNFSEYPVIVNPYNGSSDAKGEIVIAEFKERGNTPGIAITKQSTYSTYSPVPLVWGTTTYPFTGRPGTFAFAGLTNPITRSETVMWHKFHMFWGGVTINGTDYLDRIYYSGQGTAESGYGDLRYDVLDGDITAMVSAGELAFISTARTTYIMYGDYFENFEFVEHEIIDSIFRQAGVCLAKNAEGLSLFYGISPKGFFEVDRQNKKYIDENIRKEIEGYDFDEGTCWFDESRTMVMFAITDNDSTVTKIVFGFNIKTRTWWKFDTPYRNGIWAQTSIEIYGRTIGNDSATGGILYYEYDTKADDTNAINAYYKTAPFYAGGGSEFSPSAIWLLARNEDATSTITVDAINDYTSAEQTLALRNTNFPDGVPVSHQLYLSGGDANSIEVKISQDVVDQDFAISGIAMDADGGQNVDQTV